MRDLAEKWSAVPDWETAAIEGTRVAVSTIHGLGQYLVSGDIGIWRARNRADGTGVGAFATASGSRYWVRLARDRLLLVDAEGSQMSTGWDEAGFATSCVSAALHVFEISGEAALDLAARATAVDPAASSASAALSFAGLNAIVYAHENGRLRVHVDRAMAPFLWKWFEAACHAIGSAPPAQASSAAAAPSPT